MESPIVQPVPSSARNNKLATAGLVTGILALLSYCLSIVISFFQSLWLPIILMGSGALLSLASLITGIIGLVQVNKSQGEQKGKGFAITGIVLGGLGVLAICILPIVVLTLLGPVIGNVFSEVNSNLNVP
ncbi:MAG: RDD domain containing protein [Anaerolineaceae bacterium]|nr:MAG: RDD domain containing protein [Anaerolineaceae bacterium]